MAWALVSVGTWDSDEGTNPALTPGAPSGSGGILLLHWSARESGMTFNVPTGWTSIGGDGTRRSVLMARVSDGGANDTPTVTLTGTSTVCAVMSRWTGGNTTLGSLLNTQNLYGYFAAETSPNGNVYCPSITPSVDNCLVIRGGMTTNDDGDWTTPPSGDTLLTQVQVNLSGDMSAAWSYRIQTTAGAVSAGDITNGGGSSDGYAIAFALTEGVSTTKYLKLLAHSSAASATGVSGVVFDGTGYTTSDYLGAFSGASFEASLESGSAVLKVAVSEFGGSALTTSSAPVAFIWNSTDAGIGPADCTVIEE